MEQPPFLTQIHSLRFFAVSLLESLLLCSITNSKFHLTMPPYLIPMEFFIRFLSLLLLEGSILQFFQLCILIHQKYQLQSTHGQKQLAINGSPVKGQKLDKVLSKSLQPSGRLEWDFYQQSLQLSSFTSQLNFYLRKFSMMEHLPKFQINTKKYMELNLKEGPDKLSIKSKNMIKFLFLLNKFFL